IRDRNVTGVQTCALPIFQQVLLAWDEKAKSGDFRAKIWNSLEVDKHPTLFEKVGHRPGQEPLGFDRASYSAKDSKYSVNFYEQRSAERRVGKEGRTRVVT